ncbi:MAG: hypothetical protein ACK4K2_00500 [Dehalococcoidia bacterium]
MLAVVSALETEIRRVLDLLPHWEQWEEGEVQFYRSPEHRLLLCLSGMGRSGVEPAIRALVRHRPRLLVSTGFVAALEEGLRPGVLVAPEQVYLLEAGGGGVIRVGPALEVDALWLAFCQHALGSSLRVVPGAITVEQVLVAPQEKRRLGLATHAAIADMESYWVGLVARAAGIPFVVVRVVVDTVHHTLPPFLKGYKGGSLERAVLRWALTRPGWWPRLWRLREAVARAQNRLGRGILALAAAWEAQREAA